MRRVRERGGQGGGLRTRGLGMREPRDGKAMVADVGEYRDLGWSMWLMLQGPL